MRKSFGGLLGCLLFASLFAACGGSPAGGGGTDEGDGGEANGGETSTGGKSSTGGKTSSSTGGKSSGNGEVGGDFARDLCRNGKLDEDETSVDCGGPCGKCEGEVCTADTECKSKVCAESEGLGGAGGIEYCQASTCGDGIVNLGEDCDSGEENGIYCTYGIGTCRVCNDECQTVDGIEPVCGDDVRQGPEVCDGEDGCRDDCSAYYKSCREYYYDGVYTDGPQTIAEDGIGEIDPHEVFCLQSWGGYTLDKLSMGRYNAYYAGYTNLYYYYLQYYQGFQKFFIWSYNKRGGLTNLDSGYTSTNCCFMDPYGITYLFGGNASYPATAGAYSCNPEDGYSAATYQLYIDGEPGVIQGSTLSSNFFSQYPPTYGYECSQGSNPSFYYTMTY